MEKRVVQISGTFRWLILFLSAVVFAFGVFFIPGLTRSLGIHSVSECPENELPPSDVQTLYERGVARADHGMVGEYRPMSSIYEALPLLRRAALHGHRDAMKTYGGFFIHQGAIEMRQFDGLSYLDAAAEGMMWSILSVHLGQAVDTHDEQTYAVLLNPQTPFPDDFFVQDSGTAWLFQMLTESGLDWARRQAFAWRTCWSGSPQ